MKLPFLALLLAASIVQAQPHATQKIIFIMTDGLRWQEVFSGADEALMNKESGVADPDAYKKLYWADTPQARRELLMPFFWGTIAKSGQVFGNRALGSDSYVTNGFNFSYPGYNETLTGFPDPRINSNDKNLNPNVTVLEWLHNKRAYKGKVAAFGAWDAFPFIFNSARAGFLVNAGYDPLTAIPVTPKLAMINQLKGEMPHLWDDEPFDAFEVHAVLEYIAVKKPRVLYLSLGETDDWAHAGVYSEYLNAAHRADMYVKMIWEKVQSMREYRGHTTLIFSPDHGRGMAPDDWKNHGEKIPDSKYIWMAWMGPDTPALGERAHIEPVTQNQIAATLAAFLGEDYAGAVPKAGKPIVDVLPKAK